MLSHNLLGQDFVLVTAQPEPVKPGKRSKEIVKIDRAKAVLNQQLIDEYWKRSATEDKSWIEVLIDPAANGKAQVKRSPVAAGTAGGGTNDLAAGENQIIGSLVPSRNEIAVSQEQAHKVAIKKRKVKSRQQSEPTAQTLSAEDATTGATAALPLGCTSTLVAEILRNLHAVVHEHTSQAIKAGIDAFSAVDLAAITEAQAQLAAVTSLQLQLARTIDLWQSERRLPEGPRHEIMDSRSLLTRASVPGLTDIFSYLSVRIQEIDRELLTAVSNREYGRMQMLADEATAMSGLSQFLDQLFPAPDSY